MNSKKKEFRTTIKNIFKIHPLVYGMAILSILTGMFQDFLIITYLILIHELGHFLMAKLFHIKVDKIVLYPIGGQSKFYMKINENRIKEWTILWMGPIFQQVAFQILMLIGRNPELIRSYHFGILFFNLLPIYPLDGGKILNLVLNHFFPLRCSYKISIYLGYGATIFLLFSNVKISVNAIIMYIVLVSLIRKEEKKESLYFQKFLLERFLKKCKFRKKIEVKNENSFYKYRYNILNEKNKKITEEEYLSKKYNFF